MSRYMYVVLILATAICVKGGKRTCINIDTSLCDGRIEDEIADLKLHTTRSLASFGEQIRRLNSGSTSSESYELRLTPRRGNFDEARQQCTSMGGKLAQRTLIKNIGGQDYESRYRSIMKVSSDVTGKNHYWIGISDSFREGTWTYLSSEAFPASTENLIADWLEGEPNNGVGWYGDAESGEDCGHLVIADCGQSVCPLLINDVNCTPSASHHGICEIEL